MFIYLIYLDRSWANNWEPHTNNGIFTNQRLGCEATNHNHGRFNKSDFCIFFCSTNLKNIRRHPIVHPILKVLECKMVDDRNAKQESFPPWDSPSGLQVASKPLESTLDVSIYIYTYMFIHKYVYIYIYTYVPNTQLNYPCMHMCIYMYIYIWYVYDIYIYVCIYIWYIIYVFYTNCMYKYVYIYIHIYIYIYVHASQFIIILQYTTIHLLTS